MERYKYNEVNRMLKNAEGCTGDINCIGDFYRTGIEIYVGSFPDVSGPDLVIDPHDKKGVELFKEFAGKLAEHYATIKI